MTEQPIREQPITEQPVTQGSTRQPAEEIRPLDGNAIAGPLRELFAVDITVARWRCVHCGSGGAVAQLRVYDRAPGIVARCTGCEGVILRLVRGPDRAWLDITGTVALQIPIPADPDAA